MFSIVEKKQRIQKGMLGPLFRKGAFLFHTSESFTPPPQKSILKMLLSFKIMVTNLLNNN